MNQARLISPGEVVEAGVDPWYRAPVGRPVWESRRLLDELDASDSAPGVDAFVRDLESSSLSMAVIRSITDIADVLGPLTHFVYNAGIPGRACIAGSSRRPASVRAMSTPRS